MDCHSSSWRRWCAVGALTLLIPAARSAPFSIRGPGVNPADFRITTFASGLDYPIGMARLTDGSILVAVSEGASFWNSTGNLLRFTDVNRDGVADGPGAVVFTGLPGGQTSLRAAGNLVFVTGQGPDKPISILRVGVTPADPLTLVGRIDINYPAGDWLHPHSALGIRETPGNPGSHDLLFQLGSDMNLATTTRTATISSATIGGATGTLNGDSIHLLTVSDHVTNVTVSGLTRVATGLRNAAGFAFHPVTGDLYFEDNGIDGLINGNEPTSADELNVIPAGAVGGSVEDFGFPTSYSTYRTGTLVGGSGIQPLVAFQPLPNPLTGSESEGPNDIAFAPRGFPGGLNHGIFVGFHGRFNFGGLANEENPLVYVDLDTFQYFHFIGNDEPGIGHLDGLMSTEDSLFVADLASSGNVNNGAGLGAIYQIKSLARPTVSSRKIGNAIEIIWTHGILQEADDLAGNWTNLPTATSPHSVDLDQPARFFRVEN